MAGVSFEKGGAAGGANTINFSDVADAVYEIMPKGVYEVEVIDNEYKESQNGNPMWEIQFEVQGGEYAGRKLRHWWTFTAAALPMVKNHVKVLAPELLEVGNFDVEDDNVVDSLVGRRCNVQVQVRRHYEDRNRKVNNVSGLLPLVEGQGDGDPFS